MPVSLSSFQKNQSPDFIGGGDDDDEIFLLFLLLYTFVLFCLCTKCGVYRHKCTLIGINAEEITINAEEIAINTEDKGGKIGAVLMLFTGVFRGKNHH